MKIYYLGQVSMANRGCEALIRSNTKIIREKYPDARFLCPSENLALDSRQWQDAALHGIEFVPVPSFPTSLKVWSRIFDAVPPARKIGVLPFSLDTDTLRRISEVDAVVMTGGDIISLEYGLNTLYFWAGLVDAAHRLGKPTHLLAASVGPFTKDPLTEKHMIAHLKHYTSISVRETASFEYLMRLGIANVRLVTDPAFVMEPQLFDTSAFLTPGRDHVGFNVSPLVRKFRADDASRVAFDVGIQAFLRRIIAETEDNVLLVPHVDPLVGAWDNSDRTYMAKLMVGLSDLGSRITMTPDLLNAAQIKHALGQCRYFIGARTHATIGAISRSVPTLSIAYSVKAIGINKDLFGHTRYVLPTPDVTEQTLWSGLEMLRLEEAEIKATLAEKLPVWKATARESLFAL
jgi:colanic acid/amylovoran biosynthesis protein